MSKSNGDPYGGGNDTYGGGHDNPASSAAHQDMGGLFERAPPTPPSHAPNDGGDCDALLDLGGLGKLGGLGSLISGLIDVDVGGGNGDGTHAAALIDVDLGGKDIASVSVLGGTDMIGGSGILNGLDASCLLDGLLCDGILS